MNHTTQAVRTAVLAALALLTAGAVPAQAAPAEQLAGNWLYVTVTRGEAQPAAPGTPGEAAAPGAPAAEDSGAVGALLICNPPQGHARADRACGELDRAGGDITRIPQSGTFCPMVYAPVTASARGEWNGKSITYDRTFANECVMNGATGSVFALAP